MNETKRNETNWRLNIEILKFESFSFWILIMHLNFHFVAAQQQVTITTAPIQVCGIFCFGFWLICSIGHFKCNQKARTVSVCFIYLFLFVGVQLFNQNKKKLN